MRMALRRRISQCGGRQSGGVRILDTGSVGWVAWGVSERSWWVIQPDPRIVSVRFSASRPSELPGFAGAVPPLRMRTDGRTWWILECWGCRYRNYNQNLPRLVALFDCELGSVCVNTVGSYVCEEDSETGSAAECPPGYQFFLVTCVDINECHENTSTCPDSHVCVNTEGSYTCQPSETFRAVLS